MVCQPHETWAEVDQRCLAEGETHKTAHLRMQCCDLNRWAILTNKMLLKVSWCLNWLHTSCYKTPTAVFLRCWTVGGWRDDFGMWNSGIQRWDNEAAPCAGHSKTIEKKSKARILQRCYGLSSKMKHQVDSGCHVDTRLIQIIYLFGRRTLHPYLLPRCVPWCCSQAMIWFLKHFEPALKAKRYTFQGFSSTAW